MTSTERRLAAQIAANTRWSRPGERRAASERAGRSLYARFEKQIDQEATEAGRHLAAGERAALVESRLKAHMAGLSLKAAKGRRRKRERSERGNAV